MRCPNDEIAQFLDEYACTSITADDTAAAMEAIGWTGYYAVVDEDLDLTGEWRYADAEEPDYYLVPSVDAVIECSVAEANGWRVDRESWTSEPQPSTPMPWPGPTRLYDPEVDAGAVLLTGEQARAVVLAIADALTNGGHDEATRQRMVSAAEVLNHTFRLGIEQC
jgi:hypothetical protein